jgi:hypothetical protein
MYVKAIAGCILLATAVWANGAARASNRTSDDTVNRSRRLT